MTIARAAVFAACLGLTGCGTFYVDDQLHDVTAADRVTVAHPGPVQVLFDFQTKGVTNSRATDYLRSEVQGVVNGSGLFSQVSDAPVPGGAVLNLTINNVPLDDSAFAKGFVTGFTFFIVGNTVGDGYICTVEYLPGAGGTRISHQARDAVYTSLGATAPTPPHARRMANIDEAVRAMARKCLGNPLNELARDLNAAAPAAPAAPTAPAVPGKTP